MTTPDHRAVAGVRHVLLVACACAVAWLAAGGTAHAQLGTLLSPGRLSRAHAKLEGLSQCQQCHERGQRVAAAKCLGCHAPIAERIRQKRGVHKDVRDECIACHAEHAGVDGELRPFDTKDFDHAGVTGFPLDGRHANLAKGCAACHTSRSFLAVRAQCASCHRDVHAPSLGANCETCHSTRAAFREAATGFDHSRAAFPLQGAHRSVACAQCHTNGRFKGVAFSTCASCHTDPHRARFGATCTTCHGTDTWRTKQVDHSRTAFALVGQHQKTECAACHRQPAMRVRPRADTCAACHADPHRGSFAQDCRSCHNEQGFGKAPFDHQQTRFSLTGAHTPLPCASCHARTPAQGPPRATRPVVSDFRGLSSTCVSCHADVHAGQLGTTCETCHTTTTFRVGTFAHTSDPAFFAGQHATLACAACHVPAAPRATRTDAPVTLNVRFRDLPRSCASCHEDVHLGQVKASCESCHSVAEAKFRTPGFSHTRTAFALTGKHEPLACAACHKRETGDFPNGHGTAVRLTGLGRECRSCHQDVHLGQLRAACETCHSTSTFAIDRYRHADRALSSLFVGRHATAACRDCHAPATTTFPAGRGTAVRFTVGRTCVSCHVDTHRGALGPDCAACHRP